MASLKQTMRFFLFRFFPHHHSAISTSTNRPVWTMKTFQRPHQRRHVTLPTGCTTSHSASSFHQPSILSERPSLLNQSHLPSLMHDCNFKRPSLKISSLSINSPWITPVIVSVLALLNVAVCDVTEKDAPTSVELSQASAFNPDLFSTASNIQQRWKKFEPFVMSHHCFRLAKMPLNQVFSGGSKHVGATQF